MDAPSQKPAPKKRCHWIIWLPQDVQTIWTTTLFATVLVQCLQTLLKRLQKGLQIILFSGSQPAPPTIQGGTCSWLLTVGRSLDVRRNDTNITVNHWTRFEFSLAPAQFVLDKIDDGVCFLSGKLNKELHYWTKDTSFRLSPGYILLPMLDTVEFFHKSHTNNRGASFLKLETWNLHIMDS